MAWRTIADSEVDPESPVTTSLAIAWRDNPIAIAQGLSGATRIVYGALNLSNDLTQGDIANSAIGQGELKTTTGTVSISPFSHGSGQTNLSIEEMELIGTLPGGQYGFNPQGRRDNISGDPEVIIAYASRGTSGAGYTRKAFGYVISSSGASSGATVQVPYVQSSPPYDLGDGVVEGFVYAYVLPDGSASRLYVGEDPPWYGNTREAPEFMFTGKDRKEYGHYRKPLATMQDVESGAVTVNDYLEKLGQFEEYDEEITTQSKMRGMDEVPHPFFGLSGGTVVLLDPMSAETGKLVRAMLLGESVHPLFANGYASIDNAALNRKAPPGVQVSAMKWRNIR